jgi:hypothetical protein
MKIFQKINVQYLKSVKEPIIRMGAPDGIWRLNPNLLEHQINQSEREFTHKNMLSTLKV